ncbi:MAG: hypothetical protein JHD16_06375 [Solirubrobacteraceae bacterium]|nr:hypothetical protein [Solirubrobacteraceae bacterium]
MGTWTESSSTRFRVRFDDEARTEVEELVHVLETVAARLEAHGLVIPDHPTIVVHPTAFSLGMAQPAFLVAQSFTESNGRRYLASWTAGSTLHLIAPQRLTRGTEGHISMRDALERAPACGLAHLALGNVNPALSLHRAVRKRAWFWLAWGAGQTLVGQVPMLASTIAARRRERRALVMPPHARDAVALGGSIVELVLRERGLTALVRLLREPLPSRPQDWLHHALPGLGATERDVHWRMLLDELDEARSVVLAERTAAELAAAAAAREEQEATEQAILEARVAKAAAEAAERAAAEVAELDAAAQRAAARSAARRRGR